jgi:hypothetical protein
MPRHAPLLIEDPPMLSIYGGFIGTKIAKGSLIRSKGVMFRPPRFYASWDAMDERQEVGVQIIVVAVITLARGAFKATPRRDVL